VDEPRTSSYLWPSFGMWGSASADRSISKTQGPVLRLHCRPRLAAADDVEPATVEIPLAPASRSGEPLSASADDAHPLRKRPHKLRLVRVTQVTSVVCARYPLEPGSFGCRGAAASADARRSLLLRTERKPGGFGYWEALNPRRSSSEGRPPGQPGKLGTRGRTETTGRQQDAVMQERLLTRGTLRRESPRRGKRTAETPDTER
jgi:hypothetical protein